MLLGGHACSQLCKLSLLPTVHPAIIHLRGEEEDEADPVGEEDQGQHYPHKRTLLLPLQEVQHTQREVDSEETELAEQGDLHVNGLREGAALQEEDELSHAEERSHPQTGHPPLLQEDKRTREEEPPRKEELLVVTGNERLAVALALVELPVGEEGRGREGAQLDGFAGEDTEHPEEEEEEHEEEANGERGGSDVDGGESGGGGSTEEESAQIEEAEEEELEGALEKAPQERADLEASTEGERLPYAGRAGALAAEVEEEEKEEGGEEQQEGATSAEEGGVGEV